MTDTRRRLATLFGATLTWAVAVATAVSAAAPHIAAVAPSSWQGPITAVIAGAAWLVTAVRQVRTHTPVASSEVGLLRPLTWPSPEVPAPETWARTTHHHLGGPGHVGAAGLEPPDDAA